MDLQHVDQRNDSFTCHTSGSLDTDSNISVNKNLQGISKPPIRGENPYRPSKRKSSCRSLPYLHSTSLQSNDANHLLRITDNSSPERSSGCRVGDRILFMKSKTALQLLVENRHNNNRNTLYLLKQRHSLVQPFGNSNCYYSSCGELKSNHWLQFPVGGVHEVVGAAGTGKTQLSLSFCTHATVSNITSEQTAGIRAIYVSLKGLSFSTRAAHRLNQIIEASTEGSDISGKKCLLNQILIKGCVNTDDLYEILDKEIPRIALDRRNNVRVLVLDSVADLFRGNLDSISVSNKSNEAAERASMLFYLSSRLKHLSDSFHPLSVFVINQVTGCEHLSVANSTSQMRSCSLSTSHTPALGLSWAHCVNSSYELTKTANATRKLTLMKSPVYQVGTSVCFTIDVGGCFISQSTA
jgi:RecA/RadA recombinase